MAFAIGICDDFSRIVSRKMSRFDKPARINASPLSKPARVSQSRPFFIVWCPDLAPDAVFSHPGFKSGTPWIG